MTDWFSRWRVDEVARAMDEPPQLIMSSEPPTDGAVDEGVPGDGDGDRHPADYSG
ncbi:hypothetical protein [Amycolatopsis sp. cmx-4-83]|uniref:hypothetical protein n=1 Tax=Amycolatopsis sp. cmx-4-83 TaxID=2790940 RepID=UPI003979C190